MLFVQFRRQPCRLKQRTTKEPAECNDLPATVDVEVSDVGCVVLVSAYDVDVDVSKAVMIGGVVVMIAAVSATHGSRIQKMKHKVNNYSKD